MDRGLSLREMDIMRLKAGENSNHRWQLFHLAGVCFSILMRLVPRARRFNVALLVARAVAPVIGRTQAYREQRSFKMDTVREISLSLVLNTLMRNGTEFDPVITVKGYEELERAFSAGKGVLVLTPHTALSLLMPRLFHDKGLDPVIIAADPLMRLSGTGLVAQTVLPSPAFLVETRSKLRAGRLVCAMPDRLEHQNGRTIEFTTANGPVIVATALMRVAERCEANVAFMEAHIDEGKVVATLAAPSPPTAPSADAITSDFVEFVRALVEARSASGG
jgi:lauroyl/myristoyl acyltransferase